MILLVLLLLAALMAFTFRKADRKQSQVRAYLTAFAVYAALLVGVWLCLALPVLLFLKG